MAAAVEKYHCTLSEELKKKALNELNEKEEWRDRDIEALREMVVAHKGLKCPTDDAYLLQFLRAKKFDYDRAYQQLIGYYEIRARNTDVLNNLLPSTVTACLDAGVSAVLPKKDKEGRKILYFRPGKWDPAKFSIYEILRVNLMSFELVVQEEDTQVNGIIAIGNFDGVGWSQAKAIERKYFKILSSLLQGAFPMRFKGMNAVNEPSVFGYIFSMVKPFLTEKIRSRMRFFGSDLKKLQDQLGLDVLPEELGGKLPHGDILAQQWKENLLAHEEFFSNQLQYHIEVDHMISSAKLDEIDCLPGTYRKLDVD